MNLVVGDAPVMSEEIRYLTLNSGQKLNPFDQYNGRDASGER